MASWWKEGATDVMKKTSCCLAQQIREIDESNAGYKERVTADKLLLCKDKRPKTMDQSQPTAKDTQIGRAHV